jgi:hypothetical protein
MQELIEIAVLSAAIAWPATVLLFSCAEVARALTMPGRH